MTDPVAIWDHLVLISGFRQRHGRATTGMDSLWHRLHSLLASPDCVVWQRSWRDDMRSLAAQIDRYALGASVRVRVVAYSWGVGHGAVQLAKELRHYGIEVDHLYSIDGVYRATFPLRIRSMFPRKCVLAPRIIIPSNVKKVTAWWQNKNLPQGHKIVGETSKQIILPGPYLTGDGHVRGQNHQTIDNDRYIHNYILEELLA